MRSPRVHAVGVLLPDGRVLAVGDLNGDGDKNDHVKIDEVVCLWGENMTDDDFAAMIAATRTTAAAPPSTSISGAWARSRWRNRSAAFSSAITA